MTAYEMHRLLGTLLALDLLVLVALLSWRLREQIRRLAAKVPTRRTRRRYRGRHAAARRIVLTLPVRVVTT